MEATAEEIAKTHEQPSKDCCTYWAMAVGRAVMANDGQGGLPTDAAVPFVLGCPGSQ
jgi:hypothetical protein